MNPAFSVIFLTTLIGVGQGLFLALYTGQLYSVVNVFSPRHSSEFYGYGSLLALAFLSAGLIASFFHLGHPERAWRSASQWKTSWLSREVIVLPAFMGTTFVYAMIQLNGWNPILFTLSDNFIVDLSLLVGAINMLLAFLLFLCTAMIYACIKFLQEWASSLTVINYTLLGMASGFTFCTAFAAYLSSDAIFIYGGWAITLTVFACITRVTSLIRNTKIKYKSNLSTAIGIRHSKIKQIAQGSMGGSFNTREYFHQAKPIIFKSIKWVFLLLVFILPTALLLSALTTNSFALCMLAFITQYLGLLTERWFFFAQANHPQNLYYQTI